MKTRITSKKQIIFPKGTSSINGTTANVKTKCTFKNFQKTSLKKNPTKAACITIENKAFIHCKKASLEIKASNNILQGDILVKKRLQHTKNAFSLTSKKDIKHFNTKKKVPINNVCSDKNTGQTTTSTQANTNLGTHYNNVILSTNTSDNNINNKDITPNSLRMLGDLFRESNFKRNIIIDGFNIKDKQNLNLLNESCDKSNDKDYKTLINYLNYNYPEFNEVHGESSGSSNSLFKKDNSKHNNSIQKDNQVLTDKDIAEINAVQSFSDFTKEISNSNHIILNGKSNSFLDSCYQDDFFQSLTGNNKPTKSFSFSDYSNYNNENVSSYLDMSEQQDYVIKNQNLSIMKKNAFQPRFLSKGITKSSICVRKNAIYNCDLIKQNLQNDENGSDSDNNNCILF
jgi:hypothetical protein